MGMPAFIGIKHSDGSIEGVYCHDGRIEELGPTLHRYYPYSAARELVDAGSWSSIKPTLGGCDSHIRSRSMSTSVRKRLYANLDELRKKKGDVFYAYFIFSDDQWYVSEGGRFLTPLWDALQQMGLLD